jgi:N-acetylglucosaminyl-diphospho-decaprenol L-rhamnosyltransferase
LRANGNSRLPLDVVVVTWNSREMVLRCLEHLDSELVQRIVVVDNASSDGTAEAVQDLHPGAHLLRLQRQEGLAFANNRGAERGSSDLILFLNDDVLPTDSSMRALVAALDRRRTAVAATGRLVGSDGRTQAEYVPQPFPTLRSLAATLAGVQRPRGAYDETATVAVDRPPGACLVVRRDVFEAVGRWDEEFAFWYEDVDLARRLREHGEVVYVPSAPFHHVGGQSAGRLSRADVVSRHYRGALLYALKHFQTLPRIGAGLLYALVAAIRLTLSRSGDDRRAYIRVFRNGLRAAAGRALLPP